MNLKTLRLLIDITSKSIDDRQLERANIEGIISTLEHNRTRLIDDFENEKQLALQNPLLPFDLSLLIQIFKDRLSKIDDDLEFQRAALESKIEEIRDLFIEQKKYEKILNNALLEAQQKLDKQEQLELDEIAARTREQLL